MSNFICSECGTNWIDCGGAGYKTPKEIETMYMLDFPHREFVYVPHPFKELAPFDGDWKDSLIKVEHKEEE